MNNQGRKLKILICLLYYVPHRTGLTIHVQQVAEELVRRGHEVTVLTARYLQEMSNDEIMHNGVRVIRLWAPIKISRGMLMPAYPIAAYRAMREAVAYARARKGPELVHARVIRPYSHSHSDDERNYKTTEERDLEMARDPIVRLAKLLVDDGLATEHDLQGIRSQIDADITGAVAGGCR